MFVLSQVGQLGDRVDERGSNTLAVVCNEGVMLLLFGLSKESNMRRKFSFWWVFFFELIVVILVLKCLREVHHAPSFCNRMLSSPVIYIRGI